MKTKIKIVEMWYVPSVAFCAVVEVAFVDANRGEKLAKEVAQNVFTFALLRDAFIPNLLRELTLK